MIAEIIPYTKLPRNLDIFDYKIDDELAAQCAPGQIVYIPFRRQKILGIIKKLKNRSDFPKLKTISEKSDYKISENALKSLYDLAHYYISSPSLILKEMIPELPKKKHETKIEWADIYQWNYDEKALLELDNVNALKKEISNQFRRYLILSNKEKRRWAFYWTYFMDYIKRDNKQLMIIFPNIQAIEAFLQFISPKYKDKITILSSKIHSKKNFYFNEWRKIKNNEVKIILGTRSAVFCPMENVETLIIDQAESRDYKQDEPNPRYHAVDVAYLNQKNYKFQLILNSLNPRFLDYFLSSEKADFQIINDYQNIKNTSHWIDMKSQAYDSDRHPLFSEEAEEIIKNAFEKKENLLILHNKKGFSNEVQCKHCHEILTCSQCEKPFHYTESQNVLSCKNCQKEEKFIKCPKCKSSEIIELSYGINHLQKYLKEKEIPSFVLEHKNYSAQKEEIIKEKMQNLEKGQIFISTNYIFSLVKPGYFKHIILINSDRLLYSNDFNANWHSFNELNELIQKSSENNVELYLQTYNIQHFVFQSLKKQKFNDFYQNEIKWRKSLNYPPFKQLVKLIYQNEDANLGEKTVKNYYQKLKTELKSNLKITFPYPIYKTSIRRQNKNTYRWIIAIRCNYNDLKPQNELYKSLEKLDPDWLIDINPENLYK